ncbi:hypothetical protein [uncultured Microbulbifer sp.]|uniref:hypothetical protein n=1 Tax=uncultured Microbulbifer sp. TaxID=348147 RepID=UPI002601EF3B|nr:hypothetical protein [uncultured Microbulbifer sp.]
MNDRDKLLNLIADKKTYLLNLEFDLDSNSKELAEVENFILSQHSNKNLDLHFLRVQESYFFGMEKSLDELRSKIETCRLNESELMEKYVSLEKKINEIEGKIFSLKKKRSFYHGVYVDQDINNLYLLRSAYKKG